MSWESIESAPRKEETIFVMDGSGSTISIAHFDRDQSAWMLGRFADWAEEYLQYMPHFWLPYSFDGNPFELSAPPSRNPPVRS